MPQRHDPGFQKARARVKVAQRTSGRISRTALAQLAAALVERGICTPQILDHRSPRTNGLELPRDYTN